MLLSKRNFMTSAFGAALFSGKGIADVETFPSVALQGEMYEAALALARKKIRGRPDAPFFKQPYVDAAFSDAIFLWDTCFIATYAKYHQDELPIGQALDNFYGVQEADGYICREYRPDGTPMWPKSHPVAIAPPLLAFAELELYGQSQKLERLQLSYPHLKANFEYLVRTYRMEDRLFFSDGLGSGMDNIPRYPDGWSDDGQGVALVELHPELFHYDGLSPKWNRQGRSVDFSAQMALFADNLITIAGLIGRQSDIAAYDVIYRETATALNSECWDEADGFYYDLGYGKRIRRKHVGMFWVLLAGIVPPDRLAPMLGHLLDPKQFWRTIPVASYPADQPSFSPAGHYWLGSMWAPTTYMVIRGLQRVGREEVAACLARKAYAGVAEVYKKTHTFWENYAPDSYSQGIPARPDFCGWTGLIPIAIYREFIA